MKKTRLFQIAVFVAVFLSVDYAYKHYFERYESSDRAIRTSHPVYHHDLVKNFSGTSEWGKRYHPVFTNSLGFKDAAVRQVKLKSAGRRILFIGDSFTEGVGLPYEETFVGYFDAATPDIEVLNAGVVSYSPSIYFTKIKYLLERGLRFDEVIVYIDVSDVNDEAVFYMQDKDGSIIDRDRSPLSRLNAFIKRNFRFTALLVKKLRHFSVRWLGLGRQVKFTPGHRAAWTYAPDVTGYGEVGVEGGLLIEKEFMDRLYALLSESGIPLSVGVYPWRLQLINDTVDSRHVTFWRDWCEGKCRAFFNHFPVMFDIAEKNPDWRSILYAKGDLHFNAQGNRILATDLLAQYRPARDAGGETSY